jgi:hypothetical protein
LSKDLISPVKHHKKRGGKGMIEQPAYQALYSGFETYAKLTAQHPESDRKTARKVLAAARLNYVENSKSDSNEQRKAKKQKLTDRVLPDVTETLDLDKLNRVKQHRSKWMAHSNVNVMFDSWQEFCIAAGFAIKPSSEMESEHVFGPSQDHRIVSLDESGIALDHVQCGKGGWPSMSLFDSCLQEVQLAGLTRMPTMLPECLEQLSVDYLL